MSRKLLVRLGPAVLALAAVLGIVLWLAIGPVGAAVGAAVVVVGGGAAIWELTPFMELRQARLARAARRREHDGGSP